MTKKRAPAKSVAQSRSHNGYWLDHAKIADDDYQWLASAQRLTLWNVDVPPGFLSRLDDLWWLDIRGGSGTDIGIAKGARKLQYLAVNQVRGLSDLSVASELTNLRYINLYGLPKVTQLPSFGALFQLERAQLGQMRGLLSLAGLLEAPNLRDLRFAKRINVSDDDVKGIIDHPTIQTFDWFTEDVPVKTWQPVMEKIGLPEGKWGHPEDWFGLDGW